MTDKNEQTTRSYGHVASILFNAPWAILPEKLHAMVEVLSLRMQGVKFTAEEIKARVGMPPQRSRQQAGAVAILPLYGVLAQRANVITDASGGTSMEQFGAAFKQAIADDNIEAVVIDVDSPGGSVHGTEELARTIYDARGAKPIIAVANALMASAAYYIASQADEIAITPTGLVGSIGVVMEHVDVSKAEEMAGVKTTLITAGKFKAEGNPFEPLSEEAHDHAQSLMNDFYEMFVNAVARGRGVIPDAVRQGFGQGRVVGAKAAVNLGMADRIATLDQVLAECMAPMDAHEMEMQAQKPDIKARTGRLWNIALMGRGG